MFAIGAQLNRLYTKDEMKKGSIIRPGATVSSTAPDGSSAEYVCVQLATGQTLLNGQAVVISGASGHNAVVGTTNTALTVGGRIGVLVLGTATATATTVGTCFAYAQIYGRTRALVASAISTAGKMMMFGANGRFTLAVAGSASAMPGGSVILVDGTSVAGLATLMLNYPYFHGHPA